MRTLVAAEGATSMDPLPLPNPAVHQEETTAPRTETIKVTLGFDEKTEIKALLGKAKAIVYSWSVEGGKVYVDFHGHDPSKGDAYWVRYKEADGVTGDNGSLVAPFPGEHGWFWLNVSETARDDHAHRHGLPGQAHQLRAAEISRVISGRQEPQLLPALSRLPTASTESQPARTASRMELAPTPKQAQTVGPGSGTSTRWPRNNQRRSTASSTECANSDVSHARGGNSPCRTIIMQAARRPSCTSATR